MAKSNELYLKIVVDDKGSPQIMRFGANVDRVTSQGRAGFGRMGNSLSDFNARASSATGVVAGLTAGVAALVISGGLAARKLVGIADTYTMLDSRLSLVTESGEELAAVQQDLYALAQRTRTEYSANIETYARLAQNTRDLHLQKSELLTITETLNKAFIISGATEAERSATMIQLSQAFSAGALRGEEFNSVAEQGSRVMQLLADYTGKSRGELRAMAEDGQLTANVLVGAILTGASGVNEEFGRMQVTVGQAGTYFSNVFGSIVADGNRATNTTEGISASVIRLADYMDAHRGDILGYWQDAAASLDDLTARIASGQMEMELQAQAGRWSAWGQDIDTTITFVTARIRDMEIDGKDGITFLTDAFREFPENVRAYIGIMTVVVASGFDTVIAAAGAFVDQAKAVFTDPLSDVSLGDRISSEYAKIDQARDESIDAILAEREAVISSTETQLEAARQQRKEYEALRVADKLNLAADRTNSADRPTQPGGATGSKGRSAAGSATVSKANAEEKAYQRGREALQRYIETQDEHIKKEYEAAVAFAKTQDERDRALAKYNEQLEAADEVSSAYSSAFGQVSTVSKEMYDNLRGQYERDRDAFISLTGDKLAAYEIYNARMRELDEKAGTYEGVDLALEDFFGDLDDLSKKNGETTDEMKNAVTGWASSWAGTLTSMVTGADVSFTSILHSFSNMLLEMLIQKSIIEPLLASFSSGSGFLGSIGKAFGFTANAHGNVYADSGLSTYRNQIVSQPTFFAFATGGVPSSSNLGVFGEAGTEGIFPVKRMSSGNLGVEANIPGGSAGDSETKGLLRDLISAVKGQGNVRVINTLNQDDIADAMSGAAGERVFLNFVARNPSVIQRAARGG